jgi:hypothetical protein
MQLLTYVTVSAILATAVSGQPATFAFVTDAAGLQKAVQDGTPYIEITEHLDMTKLPGFTSLSPPPTTFSIVVRSHLPNQSARCLVEWVFLGCTHQQTTFSILMHSHLPNHQSAMDQDRRSGSLPSPHLPEQNAADQEPPRLQEVSGRYISAMQSVHGDKSRCIDHVIHCL